MINVIRIIFFILMILLSAFFSGVEIVYVSANKVRLKMAAEDGEKSAIRAQYINDHYTASLSAILLGNNLVNIVATTIGTMFAVYYIESEDVAQTVSTIVVTVVLLIFGEIFPKILGARFSDKLVRPLSLPLKIAMFLFYPVVWLTEKAMRKLSPLWTPKETAPSVTTEELVTIVEEMEEEGGFSEEESDLIRSAIEFNEITAKDIITPRVDTSAFNIDDGLEELVKDSDLLSYSRFPVYKETMDNVIGIISTRKFVHEYFKKGNDLDVYSVIEEPMFVHMTREISSILTEMKEKNCEMAIVLDEFGGMLGIITAEDIVEEIVGDIYDEGDDVEDDIVRRGDVIEIDGSMNIHDFFDEFDLNENDFESEYTTMGGLASEILDKIPEKGDSFEFMGYDMTVAEVSLNRVEKISAFKIPEPDGEDKETEDRD